MSFVSEVVSSLTGSGTEVYDLVVVGSGFAVCSRQQRMYG